jgi:hypothetical protein
MFLRGGHIANRRFGTGLLIRVIREIRGLSELSRRDNDAWQNGIFVRFIAHTGVRLKDFFHFYQ